MTTPLQPNLQRIQLWIDALRSGNYAQCREKLSAGEGERRAYCCLGVACEVAIAQSAPGVASYYRMDDCWTYYGDADKMTDLEDLNQSGDWSDGELPRAVAAWFGIERDPELLTGEVYYDEDQSDPDNPVGAYELEMSASTLNDDSEYTFEQIANALERTYLTDGVDGAASQQV